jgi:hypothetical protein
VAWCFVTLASASVHAIFAGLRRRKEKKGGERRRKEKKREESRRRWRKVEKGGER